MAFCVEDHPSGINGNGTVYAFWTVSDLFLSVVLIRHFSGRLGSVFIRELSFLAGGGALCL